MSPRWPAALWVRSSAMAVSRHAHRDDLSRASPTRRSGFTSACSGVPPCQRAARSTRGMDVERKAVIKSTRRDRADRTIAVDERVPHRISLALGRTPMPLYGDGGRIGRRLLLSLSTAGCELRRQRLGLEPDRTRRLLHQPSCLPNLVPSDARPPAPQDQGFLRARRCLLPLVPGRRAA
jgi:hypothetical protein